jgi:hypothetical protein
MKTKIEFTSNYGFDHNWILVCETPKQKRAFYLGQDVKFCHRVLGLTPRDIVEAIGTREIDTKQGNLKLAKFICKQIGLDGRSMHKLQDWVLCSE